MPELTYFFLVRFADQWQKTLIISRANLLNEYLNYNIGTRFNDNLTLYFSFQNEKVACSGAGFSAYLNSFEDYPAIEH